LRFGDTVAEPSGATRPDGKLKSSQDDAEQKDVTRELTAEAVGSDNGWDYVAGCDFQKTPGTCAVVGKLYRDERGKVVLWVREFIGTRGTEADLSQAFISHGFYPGKVDYEGKAASSLLIVGDATGARQDAEHLKRNPYSFIQLESDGWKVIGPMVHHKNRIPWNPLVLDSRKQMHQLFAEGQILISPSCAEVSPGFPSLIESFKRCKVNEAGKFIRKEHFTHGPDGVRYLAWRFLPRPKPPAPDTSFDYETFNALSRVKLGWGRG
jgi:hypothetical protein